MCGGGPTGAGTGRLGVLRGGGGWFGAQNLREANRFHYSPGNRRQYFGLRLAGG